MRWAQTVEPATIPEPMPPVVAAPLSAVAAESPARTWHYCNLIGKETVTPIVIDACIALNSLQGFEEFVPQHAADARALIAKLKATLAERHGFEFKDAWTTYEDWEEDVCTRCGCEYSMQLSRVHVEVVRSKQYSKHKCTHLYGGVTPPNEDDGFFSRNPRHRPVCLVCCSPVDVWSASHMTCGCSDDAARFRAFDDVLLRLGDGSPGSARVPCKGGWRMVHQQYVALGVNPCACPCEHKVLKAQGCCGPVTK